jgi:hypothetical protein
VACRLAGNLDDFPSPPRLLLLLLEALDAPPALYVVASGHTAVVLLLLLPPCGVKCGVVPMASRSQSSSSRDMLGLVATGHP